MVAINGEIVGQAKTHTHDRQAHEPIAAAVIPAGHHYVQGTSPDSFDSRYRASGLVRADQVLGTVIPLFGRGTAMQHARQLAATLLAVFALATAASGPVFAQTSPAQPGAPGTGEMPIEDYLALLAVRSTLAPSGRPTKSVSRIKSAPNEIGLQPSPMLDLRLGVVHLAGQ